MTTVLRDMIFGEVCDERRRQIAKWGEDHQTHPHMRAEGGTILYWRQQMQIAKDVCDRSNQDVISWEEILWEEVTEALAELDWPRRRQELIQVMAVCLAEIEDGDTRPDEPLTEVSTDDGREASMRRHPASQRHPGDSECNSAGSST